MVGPSTQGTLLQKMETIDPPGTREVVWYTSILGVALFIDKDTMNN